MKDNDLIKQIEVQLSERQIQDVFADEKPHEFTFFTAIFLDGVAIETPAFRPILYRKELDSFEAFDKALDDYAKMMGGVQLEAANSSLLALRAAAVAGMVMVAEMVNKPQQVTPEMKAAFSIIGNVLGMPEDLRSNALGLPGELLTKFTDYIANTEIPTVTIPEAYK